MNKIFLKDLDRTLKALLSAFLITLLIGIFFGLGYLYLNTSIETTGIVEQYNGSEAEINDIPNKFPKPLENMVLTAHNHINTFAIISLLIGLIFYFSSIIKTKLKLFLIIEPFVSTILTFLSLFLMRYVSDIYVYIVILSGIAMYLSWVTMIAISLYELVLKKQ